MDLTVKEHTTRIFDETTFGTLNEKILHFSNYLLTKTFIDVIPHISIEYLTSQLKDKNIEKKTCALAFIRTCVDTLGMMFEPYFMILFPDILHLFHDKNKHIQDTSLALCTTFCSRVNPYATGMILEVLFLGMKSDLWRIKIGSCKLVHELYENAAYQISRNLPTIVPSVSHLMYDTHPEVRQTSKNALLKCCSVIENPDIKHIIPELVEAHGNPKMTTPVIDKLMGTTFVHQVEITTLSVIEPLLTRALKNRDSQLQRKACVVIINMAELVNDTQDVLPFLPKILPALKKIEDEASFPEIRAIAAQAKAKITIEKK